MSCEMRQKLIFSAITPLAFFVFGGSGHASTAETLAKINALPKAERQKALEDGARKEGSVTVYGVLNADEHGPITAGFTKKYPFLNVDFLRGAAAKNFERAIMEKRAGKVRGDIFIGATLEMIIARREGIFAPYRSPEAQAYADSFKDPDGYWISMGMGINVIAYNSSLLPEAEAPKGYPDLINPKWKGKIGVDMEIEKTATALVQSWGWEKARDYFTRLAQSEPQYRKGHTLLVQLLCAGEFPIVFEAYAYRAADMANKGCPLKMVFGDPVPVGAEPLALVNDAPHPHVAALYYDFLLTPAGVELFRSHGRTPTRPGVESIYPQLKGVKEKKNLFVLSPNTFGEIYPRVSGLLKETLFKGRR
jgi:iron(III) transport system substrate-binding protein